MGSMHTLIVMPGVKERPLHNTNNHTLIDSKDFTSAYCCRTIAGAWYDQIQIWYSEDPEATLYALSRLHSNINVDDFTSVLMTRKVWVNLQRYMISQQHIVGYWWNIFVKEKLTVVEDIC